MSPDPTKDRGQVYTAHSCQQNAKRRRLDGCALPSLQWSLCDLPLELLLYILHFLPLEDLENFACTASLCRQVRDHASLDQTRIGSIVVSNQSTSLLEGQRQSASFFLKQVLYQGWNRHFHGNRTGLRISGLECVESSKMSEITKLSRSSKLENVSYLDASFDSTLEPSARKVKNSVVKSLALILPNLRVVDLSYMKVTETAVNAFAQHCPNLEVFRWAGSDDGLQLSGSNLSICRHLKELIIEDARLYCSIRRTPEVLSFLEAGDQEHLESCVDVLSFCSNNLERVGIAGSKWYNWDISMPYPLGKGPVADIPQSALIRFVRETPTLKWFRSDLSTDNVTKLAKEFPHICFS